MLPLSIGGHQVPWNHPIVFILLGFAMTCLMIFVIIEHCWAVDPIVPPALMRNRDAMASFGALTFQAAAHIGVSCQDE